MPIESVSKMLGHTNIKATQLYARITISQKMCNFANKRNRDCFVILNELKDLQ